MNWNMELHEFATPTQNAPFILRSIPYGMIDFLSWHLSKNIWVIIIKKLGTTKIFFSAIIIITVYHAFLFFILRLYSFRLNYLKKINAKKHDDEIIIYRKTLLYSKLETHSNFCSSLILPIHSQNSIWQDWIKINFFKKIIG